MASRLPVRGFAAGLPAPHRMHRRAALAPSRSGRHRAAGTGAQTGNNSLVAAVLGYLPQRTLPLGRMRACGSFELATGEATSGQRAHRAALGSNGG
jgi:hypothetical protein